MNCIFSIYIQNKNFDPKMADKKYNDSVRFNAYEKHYQKLLWSKAEYATEIGAEFHMFDSRDKLDEFSRIYNISDMSMFDQINFYKLHLLEELSELYDNVLYLDFDVIPTTDEDFFDAHDMEKGIYVMARVPENTLDNLHKPRVWLHHTIRSPQTKYWNSHALLLFDDLSVENNTVFNTGIVASNAEFIKQLDYFGEFGMDIKRMEDAKTDGLDVYPSELVDLFGFDNETLFAYKILKRQVPWVNLDDKWHHIFDKETLDRQAKLVHVINKEFEKV